MKCIILAGGFATRLWPLTENKAKPLLHLKDKPLISHIVERVPAYIPIVVSTNSIFEESFKQWARGFSHRDIKIFVEDSASDEFKRGALGATAHAIETLKIEEDLMLLAGDNYFGFKVDDFLDHFQGNPLLAAYDIQDKQAARRFGVVIEQDGKALEFQEKPEDPKSTLVSTGCFVFPEKNLKDIVHYAKLKKDDLGGIFEYLLSEKGQEVDVFTFTEPWVDIGSFKAYLAGNQMLMGAQVIEKDNVTKKGHNQLLGSVYLGENAEIQDSVLENVIVLKNIKIKNCVIRNCVIDEDTILTNIDLSHKMIRQGSRIEKSLSFF